MSLLDDRSVIILEKGVVRTRFKTRDSDKATYKYESFPRPKKSDDTKNSSVNSKIRGSEAYWYW